jgi:hypothetical protein
MSMGSMDRQAIAVDICRKWPNKFEDSELEDFIGYFESSRKEDVLAALRDYKQGEKGHFKPNVHAIRARMPRALGAVTVTKTGGNREGFDPASFFREIYHELRSEPSDIAVILRVYAQHYREKGLTQDFDKERERIGEACKRLCRNDLFAQGILDRERIEALADCVTWRRDAFRQAILDIREGVEVREEVPV